MRHPQRVSDDRAKDRFKCPLGCVDNRLISAAYISANTTMREPQLHLSDRWIIEFNLTWLWGQGPHMIRRYAFPLNRDGLFIQAQTPLWQ
jgi:hypothetical protein